MLRNLEAGAAEGRKQTVPLDEQVARQRRDEQEVLGGVAPIALAWPRCGLGRCAGRPLRRRASSRGLARWLAAVTLGLIRLVLSRRAVACDPLLPLAGAAGTLHGGRRWTADSIGRRQGAGQRAPVDVEQDGTPFWEDVRHGGERQQAPPPEYDAVMTDRDSFAGRSCEFDEQPDPFSLSSEDDVPPRCGEQFTDLPRIAPAWSCRFHAWE
jgi:hypothetical protein